MATVTVSFDTKEKTLTVQMDGEVVNDLQEVVFYKAYEGDDYRCSIATMSEDEDEGVRTMTRLSASEAGLVPSTLGVDVANYLGAGK